MKLHLTFIFTLLLPNSLILGKDTVQERDNAESRLIRHLLNPHNYNPEARPVMNKSEPVLLKTYMELSQIIELNMREQYMKFKSYIVMIWHDQFLTWKPDEFGGVTRIRLSMEKVRTLTVIVLTTL